MSELYKMKQGPEIESQPDGSAYFPHFDVYLL
jgi:hypothetical protein